MSNERFHRAAREGLLDALKDATKKEANCRDANGMTPVLWAAFEGRLDALRLLVGRGGDPDRADQFGNTALHLCAARGHLSCVDFLAKFGSNLFALDVDAHTAQDLAAINGRDTVLAYLDSAAVHLEATDRKRAQALKDAARHLYEKRLKEFAKGTQKAPKANILQTWKCKLRGGGGGGQGKPPTGKRTPLLQTNDDFKISEIEVDGKRSVRSIRGLQRDSEVLYIGNYERHAALSRSKSQPDLLDKDEEEERNELPQAPGLFDRPKLGTLTFSQSFASGIARIDADSDSSAAKRRQKSGRTRYQYDSEDSEEESSIVEEFKDELRSIDRFLIAWGLEDFSELFRRQQIDLETLMMLTESDLKSLNLPLGPFRKLCIAIQERKMAFREPGSIIDSHC